ncbi:hypothetical protein KY389_07025 [Paracoccus bogoriensis]|uniref:hypothetical protein n=1 Tax=Paracoccus bogoriensis TaxID=242065 RepID=UPI001CA51551|nr:hypothetical protein [Paracoccus bogoriensis]MBW7056448.1 hypothetical protein [Paracoccus bogoriensis]
MEEQRNAQGMVTDARLEDRIGWQKRLADSMGGGKDALGEGADQRPPSDRIVSEDVNPERRVAAAESVAAQSRPEANNAPREVAARVDGQTGLDDLGLSSDPAAFVLAPDGSDTFGQISTDIAAAIGRQGGPIRMRIGDNASGMRHIEARHGDQIRDLGYESIPDFVASIARNFEAIYRRDDRALDLVLDADQRGLLVVQLEPDASGDFHDVRTATPIRRGQYDRKEPLWEKTGPRTSSDLSNPLDPKGQSGAVNMGADDASGKTAPRPTAPDASSSGPISTAPRAPAPRPTATEGISNSGQTPDAPGPAPAASGIAAALSPEDQARMAELKKKLAARLRNQANSGLDPEILGMAVELTGLYIKAGARKFGAMLRDFMGDTGLTVAESQRYMRAAYADVRDNMDLNGEDVSGFDTADQVMAEVRKALAEENAAPEQSTGSQDAADRDNIGRNAQKEGRSHDRNGIDEGDDRAGASQGARDPEPGAERTQGIRRGRGGKNAGESGPEPAQERPVRGRDDARDGDGGSLGRTDDGRRLEAPRNHVIPESGLDLPGGDKTRARNAIKTIEIVRTPEREGRPATDDERAAMAKYGGAGVLAPALPDSTGRVRMPDIAADLDRLLTPQGTHDGRKDQPICVLYGRDRLAEYVGSGAAPWFQGWACVRAWYGCRWLRGHDACGYQCPLSRHRTGPHHGKDCSGSLSPRRHQARRLHPDRVATLNRPWFTGE